MKNFSKSSILITLVFSILIYDIANTQESPIYEFPYKIDTTEVFQAELDYLIKEVDSLSKLLDEKKVKIKTQTKDLTIYMGEALEQQTKIMNLETQKKSEGKRRVVTAEIDEKILNLNAQNSNTQKEFNNASYLQFEIQELNKELEERTKYLRWLANHRSELTEDEIDKLSEQLDAAQKKVEKENAEKKQHLRNETLLFVGNIQGWASIVSKYEMHTLAAKSLLLFDTKTNKKLLKFLTNGAPNLLTLLSAVLAYDNINNDKITEGWLYIASGLAIQLIPELIGDDFVISTYESVTRNVAFHDQIVAINDLAKILNVNVSLLNGQIQAVEPLTDFRPSANDLLLYREVITTLTKIQQENQELRNKAQYLLGLNSQKVHGLTNNGKEFLEKIIAIYEQSIKAHKELTAVLLNRYNLLNQALIDKVNY